MTDQFPPEASAPVDAAPPAPVPPELQVTPAEAQAAARQQIAAAAGDLPAGDAAATIEQIKADAIRSVLLPMEQKIDQLVAGFKATSDTQAAQIKALQAQLVSAQQTLGPPDVIKYATAVHERLQNAADTAGLPKDHWSGILAHTAQVLEDAKAAVQSGDGSKIIGAIDAIDRFVTRTHPRLSNVRVEQFPALLVDLEELGSAALKLLPAVA